MAIVKVINTGKINLLTSAGTTTTGGTRAGCGSGCAKVTSSSLCAGR